MILVSAKSAVVWGSIAVRTADGLAVGLWRRE